MRDDEIWICTRLMAGDAMPFVNNLYEADAQAYVDTLKRNSRGKAPPAENFPTEIYAEYKDGPRYGRLPDLCNASGYLVSQKVADVFATVEMGKTALHSTKAFQADRRTPVPGTYYCLAFGEIKDAFVPDMSSPKIQQIDNTEPPVWLPPYVKRDGDIAVRAAALTGPELWMDPNIHSSFFVSGGLAKALIDAGLKKDFRLTRCRLIHDM